MSLHVLQTHGSNIQTSHVVNIRIGLGTLFRDHSAFLQQLHKHDVYIYGSDVAVSMAVCIQGCTDGVVP